MGKKKGVLSAGNFMIPVSSVSNVLSNIPPITSNIQQPVVGVPSINLPNPTQMGGVDPFSQMIMMLNTNPYLVAIFMLVLNLGGRFLALELTKKQELFLQQAWIRPLIFFTVIFVATRNLVVAFWVTLFFFFALLYDTKLVRS
jgi:hypothetical protein